LASTKSLNDPPSSETIEVSLFGPGYGESCLIHIGWNDWLVIDSCKDQRSGVNPVLDYLGRIGANPADCVKLIVASHAHDDHIAGLSQIVEQCESAAFVCSAALTKKQFFALLEFDQAIQAMTRHSAYAEFRKINEILGG
jgi:metal-dependent hydrolase (beta-lactamase superfamily II)